CGPLALSWSTMSWTVPAIVSGMRPIARPYFSSIGQQISAPARTRSIAVASCASGFGAPIAFTDRRIASRRTARRRSRTLPHHEGDVVVEVELGDPKVEQLGPPHAGVDE